MNSLEPSGYVLSKQVLHRTRRRIYALIPIALAVIVLSAWWASYRVHVTRGSSMSPALDAGDLMVTRSVSASALHRGDIITFRDRASHDDLVTRRVLAVLRAGGAADPVQTLTVITRADSAGVGQTWNVSWQVSVERRVFQLPALGLVLINQTLRWTACTLAAAVATLLIFRRLRAFPGTAWPRSAQPSGVALCWLVFAGVATLIAIPNFGTWNAADATAANAFKAAAP